MLIIPKYLRSAKQRDAVCKNMKSLPQWYDLMQKIRRWYFKKGLSWGFRNRVNVISIVKGMLEEMCKEITKKMRREERAEYFHVFRTCLGSARHGHINPFIEMDLNEWGYHTDESYCPLPFRTPRSKKKQRLAWSSTALNKTKYKTYKKEQIKTYEETIEKVAKNIA